MKKRFEDKTYMITGANSGMGKCVMNFLLQEGASLFLVDKNDDFIKSIKGEGKAKVGYSCFDLNCPEKISSLFDDAKSKGFIFVFQYMIQL